MRLNHAARVLGMKLDANTEALLANLKDVKPVDKGLWK